MICYFNKNETVFSHNGLGVLDNHIINAVVTEELNGIFSLEFDYPIHAPHADGLLQERVVRCPVPGMDDQLFRISEREDTIGGLFHVVAYHVFYDLAQNLIEDTFVVNRNGTQAIQQILNAGQYLHPFTGGSNIGVFNSARIVRFNIAEILMDGDIENGFVKLIFRRFVPFHQSFVPPMVFVLVLSGVSVFLDGFSDELHDHSTLIGEGDRFFIKRGGVGQRGDDILVIISQSRPLFIKPIKRFHEQSFQDILVQMRSLAFCAVLEFFVALPNDTTVFAGAVPYG
jgi:hypothetical protein